MTGWRDLTLGMVLCMGTLPAFAATTTLSPGANITSAVEAASDGDVIQLNPGDYFPAGTPAWSDANAFGITKAVKIIGLGTSPSQVKLHGGSGIDYSVKFMRYIFAVNGTPGNPSGARLENLTVDTGQGGILIFDPVYSTRLTDITIKDVIIQTAMAGGSFGVLLKNTDRVVIDNVTVTSYQSGFALIDAGDTLMMNSTVTSTGAESAAGLAVFGGSGNTVVGNTIGSPKANPALDSSYSFAAGGVVFYNSQTNRFENNTVQGHRDDGLDFHALNLFGTLTGAAATQQSIDNYAGKNNIVSTGFAAGRTAGSGVWVNCSSNNTWLYANDSHGSAECGTCVWLSRNNMLLANSLHNNRLAGIVVSGGAGNPPFCANPAYQQKPTANFLHSNNIYYNGNEQVVVRSSDSTDISLNFMSAKNGFGGAAQACVTTGCQAAFALEGDPADSAATSNGVIVAANTSSDNQRGIQNDDGKVSGLDFYFNRMLLSSSNRFVSSGLNIDRGSSLGGNYWTQHGASGNPSTSTPYTGVFQSVANATGLVVDRYPYQTEDFGRGQGVTVYEPLAGTVAPGTRRTVRWYAPGCTYADVSLDGATDLASNLPNIGYAVVTIPGSASAGSHTIVVKCKDSSGIIRGQGSSSTINITNSTLQLMAPGRDDVFNASQQIFVGWKKSSAITGVDIDFSPDKGVTFTRLLSGQTGTFARVTLPAIASTAYAVIRVTQGSPAGDSTDGVFAVRGTSGTGFANVTAGRKFVMGQLERLEWASPQNSRLVDITANVGGTTKSVATNLPDRGNFDWIVPDMGVGGLNLTISFKTTNGTALSSASTSQGSTLYPTTITFGAAPSLIAGGNATVSATTNSLVAVTFSSLTSSVCTISGSTVTGVANGVCTIAANAIGGGNYIAASQVTQSFTVGTSQTITFGAAPTLVVDGTATVSATASSGLPVTFSSLTSSVCTVSGTSVSGIAAGTCTIAANQAGNGTYSTAPQVTQSFTVVVATTIPRLANISTRGQVLTGDNVMIGGFIIGGSSPKKVLIRAVGPNLANFGVPGVLANPMLQLYSGQTVIASNDDWGPASNSAAIQATGLAPVSPQESAILTTLAPGAYTAIVSGVGGGTGVGIVEVFEADHPEYPLINISTRGQVQTGDNVMIGGFIIQGNASQTVLIRAVGPNLANFGVPGVLANPTLQLYSGQTVIASNDDWQSASNAAEIQATGLAPVSSLESAILITLAPGAYTAIVSGVGGGTGVGIVEVFAR